MFDKWALKLTKPVVDRMADYAPAFWRIGLVMAHQ